MVVGAIVVATTWRRTFHKRTQCIQSNHHLRRHSSGACPAFAWLVRTCLPLRRPRGESWAWDALVAFLSCASQGVHPTHPPPGHSWAAQSRRLDEHLGKSSAERTLGGLPLFLFSPAAGASSDVEAAVPAPLFLFLLPLGRPRPRFAGVGARPGRGTRRSVSSSTRLVIDHCRTRQTGRARKKKGGGRGED